MEPRFSAGDKVKVVRICPSICKTDSAGDDLTEEGLEKLEAYIGKIITIKSIDVGNDYVSYDIEGITDCFYQQELDWP